MFFYPNLYKFQLNIEVQRVSKWLSVFLGVTALSMIKLYYPIPSITPALFWIFRVLYWICLLGASFFDRAAFKDRRLEENLRASSAARLLPLFLFFYLAFVVVLASILAYGLCGISAEASLFDDYPMAFRVYTAAVVYCECFVCNLQIDALALKLLVGDDTEFLKNQTTRAVGWKSVAANLFVMCVLLYCYSFDEDPKLWLAISPFCIALLANNMTHLVMKIVWNHPIYRERLVSMALNDMEETILSEKRPLVLPA